MKFSTAKRHLREGSKNIIRNSWMTVAAVGAVTTTLVLVGIFLTLIMNINQIADNIEEDVQLKVYIDLAAQQEQVDELEQEISQISGVTKLEYSSKEEELENLIEDLGEEGEQWELFEQANPLNDAFVVQTQAADQYQRVSKEILAMDNVESVDYSENVVERLLTFNDYARYIGIAFIGALLLTAIFLISNTIKMTILARQDEIGIMKLVGAKNSFIRWPFFIEGLLMGVLGSIIPISIVMGGYYYLYENFRDSINVPFVELLPFNPFALQISLLLLGIGVFIGVWGSVMSVRKFLKV
ncbi:cell division protein FtsX [Halalkalibacillus sediminis]|uniref:Cell division protein FtsX n=1 Tax=Halalkalibacillus sediminis TaxID=2018042 RepID=A0A2I0QV73_9BACI|nr:permease-like cell division protein FtsX [Halalkalibacillus sediminis]PKR78000.1 cell division protein FtsX [Halalkalibacillus sediminis]